MYSEAASLRVKTRNVNVDDRSASVVAAIKMTRVGQQFRKKQTTTCKFKKSLLHIGNERGSLTLSVHYVPTNNISIYNKLEEVSHNTNSATPTLTQCHQLLCTEFLVVQAIYATMYSDKGEAKTTGAGTSRDVAAALVHILYCNSKALPLLRHAISKEVANTSTLTITTGDELTNFCILSMQLMKFCCFVPKVWHVG